MRIEALRDQPGFSLLVDTWGGRAPSLAVGFDSPTPADSGFAGGSATHPVFHGRLISRHNPCIAIDFPVEESHDICHACYPRSARATFAEDQDSEPAFSSTDVRGR